MSADECAACPSARGPSRRPAPSLVNIPRLVTAYYTERPDPGLPGQRVAFGTSGHRGSFARRRASTSAHILADDPGHLPIPEGAEDRWPLFLGMDTHALAPRTGLLASALEESQRTGCGKVMVAVHDEYTPTPTVSDAILDLQPRRKTGLADGIVITPSHNPPHDRGTNTTHQTGGPAQRGVTIWIQAKANQSSTHGSTGTRSAIRAGAPRPDHAPLDYLDDYTTGLDSVVDMEAIRGSSLRLGVDRSAARVSGTGRPSPSGTASGSTSSTRTSTRLSFHDGRLGRRVPDGPIVVP